MAGVALATLGVTFIVVDASDDSADVSLRFGPGFVGALFASAIGPLHITADGTITWFDTASGTAYRYVPNEPEPAVLLAGELRPRALTTMGEDLVWLTAGPSSSPEPMLRRASWSDVLAGGDAPAPTTLADLPLPGSDVLIDNGHVYWIESEGKLDARPPRFARVPLGGGDTEVFVGGLPNTGYLHLAADETYFDVTEQTATPPKIRVLRVHRQSAPRAP